MRQLKSSILVGVLALMTAVLSLATLSAQSAQPITITVEDSAGAALRGAVVRDATGRTLGKTGADGRATLVCATPCAVVVMAAGFADAPLQASDAETVRLQPAAETELVTVTAYRAPLAALSSPVTTRTLTPQELETTAAVTLDSKMRQVPGMELFRRSSSLVANPSSVGISLRGLGSTAASRTLLTEDDVPLNDPFAGWIHWQEQPELTIRSIELVRGGASDLYGSSAIGGVVNIVPMRPAATMAELRSSYGAEGTHDENLLLETKRGPWGALAAGGILGTDGYIQEAPYQRGPVDIASNVHSQSGMFLGEHDRGGLRLLARMSGFNDARSNGTPLQTNGMRLWRYATGGDWQRPRGGTLGVRAYGSAEHFRQVFSSINNLPAAAFPACVYRCGETETRSSLSPENELGAVAHWTQPLGAGLMLVAGADAHDVRVWDREQTYGTTAALTNLHDHQRDSAAYAEAMWVHADWTLTAAARMDWFQNYDGQSLKWNGAAWTPGASQPPRFDQRVFDPRMGLSRKLGSYWALSATGFRAFRAPTPNELYRSTQVGNQLTLPDGSLLSERATGWETGVATEYRWGSVRTSYFDTQVNRPIVAVTVNPNSSPILLQRENLGQIESRGVSIDFQVAARRWLSAEGGYQFAHATVTRGTQDLGNWIPEVARNLATLNLRASQPKLGDLSLQGRLSGRQYDDDANQYLLHGFFRLDAFASHDFGKRGQIFAAGENLLDRTIEVGKTPTATLADRRTTRIGIQVRVGRENR